MGLRAGWGKEGHLPTILLRPEGKSDPQKDLKVDPLEPYGRLYKDYIGVTMGLYRGSNF